MPDDVEDLYRRHGFIVLRQAIDATRLLRESRSALDAAYPTTSTTNRRTSAQIAFRYVPMMCERTPYSVELVARLRPVASLLMGDVVLPVRAKAVEYHGSSAWHRDSDLPVASIGLMAYLDPLTEATGALRVLPGSHRGTTPASPAPETGVDVIDTIPGDLIAFDEHLAHSSAGGMVRLQWRVDYVAVGKLAAHQGHLREYFARIFPPDLEAGYDTSHYPTYGDWWRSQLDDEDDTSYRLLRAYQAAATQEARNVDRTQATRTDRSRM